MKQYWDVMFGVSGAITTLSLTLVNQLLAFCAGVVTLLILGLRLRREWQHRDKPPEDKI